MRRVLIILGILLLPLTPVVLVVTGVLKSKPQTLPKVELTVWGTDDDEKAIAALTAKYRQSRSYVTVTYVKQRAEDYQQQLISAWAQGTGPDIFFVPATWIGQMSQYAFPMPANIGVPQVKVEKGVLGTTTKIVADSRPAPSTATLERTFIEAATVDVVRDGQIWGLPLSMDTLVLYYNEDLLNNAKIFKPASTWGELKAQVESSQLTIADDQGRLIQYGAGLGAADNVPYATDLLTLLMMQNGSAMIDRDGQAHLNDADALNALQFFLSFAQSRKTNYTWDAAGTNARDAFLQGKLAYYFGTLADRATIQGSNVNWGVSSMLHVSKAGDNDGRKKNAAGESPIRFLDAARYQVAMVSKAGALAGRGTYAWNYLNSVSDPTNVGSYIQITGRLPAVRDLLAQLESSQDLGLYAKQLLTALTWYHGNDGPAADTYLRQLITAGLQEKSTLTELLERTNKQIQSTL